MNSTDEAEINNVLFALDIGTRTVIGTVGVIKDKKFSVLAEALVEHEERAMIDGQIHDINLVANAVKMVKNQLEKKLNISLENVCIAAAGRFLKTVEVRYDAELESDMEIHRDFIRSLELTAVKKAESSVINETKGKLYCVGYSVKNYYLNGFKISNLLSHKGENASVEIIATFLPRAVIESLYSVMKIVGLNVSCLTLEPIAAIEAVIPQKLRLLNLALVDIGAGTSDIAICSNDTVAAYGMVPLAGDEITEIIAKNYLIDFNAAEEIKKQLLVNENIKYTDVLGIENQVQSSEILNFISPLVKKIAEQVGSKIMELNNGKSPNAVFLVGGGAYTPYYKEFLAEKLNIMPQRIAIKGRESVEACINQDLNLGSTGITVLGIALVSLKELGHDFIDVALNGSVISLFNSKNHTVLDVLIQAGINPKILIPKNGKNIKFILNNVNRICFGTMGRPSEIKINGFSSNIESNIKEGDSIEIKYAVDGLSGEPYIKDYVKDLNSISFYLNNNLVNMDPVAFINNNKVQINEEIKENDVVKIIYPRSLGDYIKYFCENTSEDYNYYINDEILDLNYLIKEGDKIFQKHDLTLSGEVYENNRLSSKEAAATNMDIKKDDALTQLKVLVNEKQVLLKGKKSYVFVDIFNFYDFDLTTVKGTLELLLNGKSAGYYDSLSDGDIISIKWI
ncbi:cell division FtsA domain-containing protein [Clostridium sp. JN-9]|uniref:cell division protein FtsA n=1 Tax=Clostridium sp. JN-9 TaxID=2507159 RepID=UPI000FFE2595|nr:cell division FtsA domain-containing protein [Clostridium sp. JN-9]QAT40308.1 cell division protein FtsA [Clostridium sp. JN-9]